MGQWSKQEIDLLKSLFPKLAPKKIMDSFKNRTFEAVVAKAKRLRCLPSPQDRFERFIRSKPTSGCWIWVGSTGWGKYGKHRHLGIIKPSHRTSWEIYKGAIPIGMLVLHKCDVKLCVNPDHLFLGTPKDNMLDKCRKGRQTKGEDVFTNKLTENDVRAIRRDQRPYKQIAQTHKICYQSVCNIKSHRSWKHI